MTTSVDFFSSRDFSADTDPLLDPFSRGVSHVRSRCILDWCNKTTLVMSIENKDGYMNNF